jgi:hypothetical protein
LLTRQKVAAVATRLDRLEREIKALKRQLERQSESFLVSIASLAPAPYLLRQEVFILVRPCDGSYVASLVDANINSSGETVAQAVANVKDMMIRLYERLGAEPKNKLGKGPARQLSVLRDLIRRKGRHAAHQ